MIQVIKLTKVKTENWKIIYDLVVLLIPIIAYVWRNTKYDACFSPPPPKKNDKNANDDSPNIRVHSNLHVGYDHLKLNWFQGWEDENKDNLCTQEVMNIFDSE